MPYPFLMPKLSPTMEEGTIVKWHKKPGDFVDFNDLIFEVTTDKATVEHHALEKGYLRKILAPEGIVANVGDVLAIFSKEQNESIEDFKIPKKPKPKEEVVIKETVKQEKVTHIPGATFVAYPPLEKHDDPYLHIEEKEIFASPLVKKIAKEYNIDLSSIKGSGPNGRIMSRDLESAGEKPTSGFYKTKMPEQMPGSFELKDLSPVRKVIAKKLARAKTFIPHFYVSQQIDVTSLMHIHDQFKANQIKITINDYIVRASALALQKHPIINCGFDSEKEQLIEFQTIDICIAVQIEDGLFTPIIRNADLKRIDRISQEAKVLAQKARNKKLLPHEYQGGSFTISNLGMYGISEFVAVINPPQSSILAVAGMQDVPAIEEDTLVNRKKMTVTLSCDHRIVDGKDAAEFLNTLKYFLENPVLLII